MKNFFVPDRADWIYFNPTSTMRGHFADIEPALLPNIEEWLQSNCPNRWSFGWNDNRYRLTFTSDEDHLLFMLTWGDNV